MRCGSTMMLRCGIVPGARPACSQRARLQQHLIPSNASAGTMRGRVVKPTAEKRSAEVFDGIVAYPDANGVECFAAFGAHQVGKLSTSTLTLTLNLTLNPNPDPNPSSMQCGVPGHHW